jgi:hypothetical protein
VAYVTGFKHDVFVSYAHIDNDDSIFPGGWITEFERRLRGALRIRLGDGDLTDICFDSGLGANERIERLIESVSGSAVFLAIGSRTYVHRPFTLRELAAFEATGASSDRIFLAEFLPLVDGGAYPPPIEDHKRLSFHEEARGSHVSMTILPDDPRFNRLINDLAEQLSRKLRALRGTPLAVAPHPTTGSTKRASEVRRTVLLAETTDDQEDDRQQVRRYLEQFGVRVLPEGSYPQGGRDFEAAFAADAVQCAIFVQLLGKTPGRRPPDLPSGYVKRQGELAKEAGLEVLQWRPPDLALDAVRDETHRQLLSGESVRVEGFESFKRHVNERASTAPPAARAKVSLAFISTDKKDLAFALRMQEEFARRDVTVALPTFQASAEGNRADLESNLIECQALIFIYGSAAPEWVRGQLRYFAKVKPRREEPPRVLALCLAPPLENDEIAMSVPGMRRVDCRALDMDAISTLIMEAVS